MNGINWTKWSSIAEIISSIAILVTLIYLAIQTEQNTEAILANTNDTIIETDLNILNMLVANPEISLSMVKTEITEQEKGALTNWVVVLLRTREHQWFQYKNGVLDQKVWESYLSGIGLNLSYPRTRRIWESLYSLNAFDNEFSEVVNDYLSEIPIRDMLIALDTLE